ncbi:DUF6538 domain-containing protein [Roseibium sediminis]|uniref:DUF6538 domain-containing protein n=1 Tax=Roseibium sediminis TaxID=1775174 RepID=UPI00123C7B2D|nr:DUF6538 domain-containing protein [Roseibium sediminis]
MADYKTYIEKKGDWYHYRRKVPAEFQDIDPRKYVKKALKTRDRAEARARALEIDRQVMAQWSALKNEKSSDPVERRKAAVDLANAHGFDYRPFPEVMNLPTAEFVARAAKLGEISSNTKLNFEALFGGATPTTEIKTSALLDEFEKLRKAELSGKSDDQLRVWRNPRKKAIANWLKVNPDLPVDQVTQFHALDFRDWWLERIETEGLKYGSANKDIVHLGKMHREICKFHRIPSVNPFSGTLLQDDEKNEQFPFSREWVQDRLLPGLAGMNDEARAIVLIVASTGARPSEIARLPKDRFILDSDIPHVLIEPTDKNKLKTKYSKRSIPLCGTALLGAEMLISLKQRKYFEKSSTLSATVNKYLAQNGLKETEKHTLYSLRHTFQDGLTALDVPDRMQTEIMGHKFDRPLYGTGPTLEHKKRIVDQLAFFLPGQTRPASITDERQSA